MGRQALSPEAIDDFRTRVVEAATELIARDGYAALTIRRLAAVLGCSAMTPYSYFRDQDEILAAVRGAAFDQFARAQEAAVRPGQAPLERLFALGKAYIGFAIENPNAYRLQFSLSQETPDDYPEQGQAELRSWHPLSDAVAAAVDTGDLEGDPLELAHLFWASMHGLASLHLAGKLVLGQELDDLVEPLLATLMRGTAKRPTHVSLHAPAGA